MKKGQSMSDEAKRKMSEAKKGKPSPRLGHRSPNLRGQYFDCAICGKSFYRSPGQINGTKGNHPKTCSKECMSVLFSGSGNPYWDKVHPEHVRARMSESKKGVPSPKKGLPGPKASVETRKKLSDTLKKRWSEHREEMIKSLPRGINHIYSKLPELRRYRKNFSPLQRREWTGDKCFYCGSTEDLVLDHIIPVFDGGTSDRLNAQTLCRGCNLWKLHYVDLPRYQSALAVQRGKDLPTV